MSKLVTVYRSQGMLPAQVIKGKLESAGVPTFLKYEALGQVLGLTIDGLGLVEVQVPDEYAEDATVLLEYSGQDDISGAVEGGDVEPPTE